MTSDGSGNGPNGPNFTGPNDQPQRGEQDEPGGRPYAPPPQPGAFSFPGMTPEPEAEAPRRGSMRSQDPETTQPRPPTVAEARARDKARRRSAELLEEQAAEAEKKRKRNRRLIGGAAVVGLVGAVAVGYSALQPDEVSASCVQTNNGEEVVVDDKYCAEGQQQSGGMGMGGLIILGGGQYRYHYGGGNQTIGQPPVGGTYTAPKGATVKTKSGSTIQRGGLGSKIGGSSGS